MKLPDNFKFGRFKLESYFVVYHTCFSHIIINDIEMIAWYDEGEEINAKLSKGEAIKVRNGDDGPFYNIKIEDKEWVEIEKI